MSPTQTGSAAGRPSQAEDKRPGRVALRGPLMSGSWTDCVNTPRYPRLPRPCSSTCAAAFRRSVRESRRQGPDRGGRGHADYTPSVRAAPAGEPVVHRRGDATLRRSRGAGRPKRAANHATSQGWRWWRCSTSGESNRQLADRGVAGDGLATCAAETGTRSTASVVATSHPQSAASISPSCRLTKAVLPAQRGMVVSTTSSAYTSPGRGAGPLYLHDRRGGLATKSASSLKVASAGG